MNHERLPGFLAIAADDGTCTDAVGTLVEPGQAINVRVDATQGPGTIIALCFRQDHGLARYVLQHRALAVVELEPDVLDDEDENDSTR